MKTLVISLFSLFLFLNINAQTYYLQAGNYYIVVKENGSFYFDTQTASRVFVDRGQIFTRRYKSFMDTHLNNQNHIYFILSGNNADSFSFEQYSNYGEWMITRQFSDGKFYLVLLNNQVKWRNNYYTGTPIILKQDSPSSTKQQKGSIGAKLIGFGNSCIKHFVELYSIDNRNTISKIEYFNANCQANFTGLPDGTYEALLFIQYKFFNGSAHQKGNDDDIKLSSKSKVTIVNGSRRVVHFRSN